MGERALIYARVSTDEQAETGYGISYQVGRGQGHCEARGYEVVKVITDDYTGMVAIRPGTTEVLDVIESLKITVVVIDRTNRLGRRASVQETLETEIEARGARVEYVSEAYDRSTAQGRAMRRVKGVFDELDYESLIDLLRSHKVEAVKRGSIIVTHAPYGYRVVKEREASDRRRTITRLVEDEDEAPIVRRIFAWYTTGDESGEPLSIKAIARKLEALGIPKRRITAKHHGTWTTATLFDMLHNETYIGKWYYHRTAVVRDGAKIRQVERPRDQWIEVPVPALVSDELFQQAQARGQQNLEQSKRNRKRTYLFSGMMRCVKCGRRFSGTTNPGKESYRFYRCGRAHQGSPCQDIAYKESAIDAVAWAWLSGLITDPDRIEENLQQRQADAQAKNARLVEHVQTINGLIARKKQEQANLVRLYAKTPLDALEAELMQLQRAIDDHQQERDRIHAQLEQALYTPEQIAHVKEFCAVVAQTIDYFTLEEKRKTYQFFQFSARLTIEDGWQVAYVECILSLDTERLLIAKQREPGSPERSTDLQITSTLS